MTRHGRQGRDLRTARDGFAPVMVVKGGSQHPISDSSGFPMACSNPAAGNQEKIYAEYTLQGMLAADWPWNDAGYGFFAVLKQVSADTG
jgi:hypothetical protein